MQKIQDKRVAKAKVETGVQADSGVVAFQFEAPQRFHDCCDNKGATLMIVRANHGHIFGGFNPSSWVSDFAYTDTLESYLFSVTDGK